MSPEFYIEDSRFLTLRNEIKRALLINDDGRGHVLLSDYLKSLGYLRLSQVPFKDYKKVRLWLTVAARDLGRYLVWGLSHMEMFDTQEAYDRYIKRREDADKAERIRQQQQAQRYDIIKALRDKGVSPRAASAVSYYLIEQGIQNISWLQSQPWDRLGPELLKLPNFGATSLKEIYLFLHGYVECSGVTPWNSKNPTNRRPQVRSWPRLARPSQRRRIKRLLREGA